MKYYIIIGISLLILLSLAIGYYFFLNNIEGYQAFSKSQIEDMSNCTIVDSSCTNIKYYDTSGNIKEGNFRYLPNNFYIDTNNILQPVPFGYQLTTDRRGYYPINENLNYSASQTFVQENAINPSICSENENIDCYDTSYVHINTNGNPEILKSRIKIPNGYYINNGIVNKIPDGYTFVSNDTTKTKIQMTSAFSQQLSKTKYDTNNYNVEYHVEPTNNMTDPNSAGPGKMWILDKSNNLVAIPFSDVSNSPLYYEPGSFRFTSSNYVPNFEETVYLSKLTNISTLSPILNTSAMGGGFCDYYKDRPDELEQKCNDLSSNTCASTSCCVLLGGQKCVYGNENGPKFKSNYSNFLVTNPEFYYYQGKCYGKCQ